MSNPQFQYTIKRPNGSEETFHWSDGTVEQCERIWQQFHHPDSRTAGFPQGGVPNLHYPVLPSAHSSAARPPAQSEGLFADPTYQQLLGQVEQLRQQISTQVQSHSPATAASAASSSRQGLPRNLEGDNFFDYLSELSPDEIDRRLEVEQALKEAAEAESGGGVFGWVNRQPRSVIWAIGILISMASGFLFLQNPSVQQTLNNILNGRTPVTQPETAKPPKSKSKTEVVPVPTEPPPNLPSANPPFFGGKS